MAEVLPLKALHYDLAKAGAAGDVLAPPYDVIEPEGRRGLLRRSPHNAVALDLPETDSGDIYEHAASLLREWTESGVLVQNENPSLWVLTQEYTGPDGVRRTRQGFLARVRVTDYGAGMVRPHERTQPGPKEDRLRLTRATEHNLSPIFSLYGGDDGKTWAALEATLADDPWAEATDEDGTVNRIWKVEDRETLDAVTTAIADSELLIADGHHRYETSRTYAEEVGSDAEGDHRYTLMCLVSLDDPGLTVFGTHRLIGGLAGNIERQEALSEAIRDLFAIEAVDGDHLDPTGAEGIGVFGYTNMLTGGSYRLTLKDPAILDLILGESVSLAYRRLDAVLLEELILKGALKMTTDDIAAKRDLGYAKSVGAVTEKLAEVGPYQAAFLLRPTPVEQVREVADAGETMPPKSTYFFPKVPTGIVFNPLT